MPATSKQLDSRTKANCADSVTVSVQSTSKTLQRNVPLTFGIDLPKGQVFDPASVSVRSSDIAEVTQVTSLAWWSDGSVKWALVDAIVTNLDPDGCELELGFEKDNSDSRINCAAAFRDISLQLGQNSLVLRRGEAEATLSFILTTPKGKKVTARLQRSISESEGPVRWTRSISGTFSEVRGLNFFARISTFRDSGRVKLDVRLHNEDRARHKGGLWDLGDSGSIQFQSFDVLIESATTESTLQFKLNEDAELQTSETLSIHQDSSGRENWNSQNHINADGHVPCRFRGYRASWQEGQESGDHAAPTLTLASEYASVSMAVPEFWQQFPKSIQADSNSMTLGLFPAEWDDTFELQGGEQKTHTVWLSLDEATTPKSLDWAHHSPRVVVPSSWHAQTEAFPYFEVASDDPHGEVRELAESAIGGNNSLVARRDVIDEFGWRNFGEVWADHEQLHFESNQPIVSHYNNQFDMVYAGLFQFARTGDTRWIELFDPLARHVIDIDIYHTKKDRERYNGGLFWHSDHYLDAATASHRTYSAHNTKPGHPYGGGPGDEHNYTTGLLYYYWQTGNRDAKDAVISLADWVINAEDGSKTLFGLVDDGPTGIMTESGSPDYHGPGRGAGNSLNALLDGWLLTGKQRYLDFAETIIQRVIHPALDIDSLDLGNVEARWSYTVFLSALAKYLDIKSEAGEFDANYNFAVSSLTHFGEWMLDHEQPYFDAPEKLEFPTETWAAQDLRKANVLRLAAKYCDEPKRGKMIHRGEELADRAWNDFNLFETKHVARSLVLTLTEGAKDCWLRLKSSSPAPESVGRRNTTDFGKPIPFVSQKARVRAQLKSPGGLARAAFSAASPLRWPRFVKALRRYLG